MRTISLYAILILLFSATLSAQTYIADKQQVSGKWKVSKSPYIVKGEAIVPQGKTLTIEPGVIVQFKTGDGHDYNEQSFDVGFLRVNGTLVAKGKPNKMIRFTRSSNDGFWGNIYCSASSKKSVLKFCQVEYAFYIREIISSGNATGAFSFTGCTALVENCLITNNGWTGLNTKDGAAPIVNYCTIANNKYGVECNSDSKPIISNSIIWNNDNVVYINSGQRTIISYSLLQSSELPDGMEDGGENIYGSNPQFIGSGDFRLIKNSPCIKKGKGKSDMGAIPFK